MPGHVGRGAAAPDTWLRTSAVMWQVPTDVFGRTSTGKDSRNVSRHRQLGGRRHGTDAGAGGPAPADRDPVVALATLGLILDGYDLVVYGTVVPLFLPDPPRSGAPSGSAR